MNTKLTLIWLLVPLATLVGYMAGRFRSAYLFQNDGEVLVRKALMKHLPADSWHLLNNVTLQLSDGTTQIDHVLVSRHGVFVIETKHYSGWIFSPAKSPPRISFTNHWRSNRCTARGRNRPTGKLWKPLQGIVSLVPRV